MQVFVTNAHCFSIEFLFYEKIHNILDIHAIGRESRRQRKISRVRKISRERKRERERSISSDL